MAKKKSTPTPNATTKTATPATYYPFVSVCTPTFNRRPFIENMFRCFRNQDYPKNRMEWIIVDDGTDKIEDLVASSKIDQIRYFRIEKKLALGEKRNLMHSYCKGSIIVYMDDDDYYPPERVSHSVERLLSHPNALCAGASEIYIYFNNLKGEEGKKGKMYQFGPYGPQHATAGTFAFRKELLLQSRYEDRAALAEERVFLKEYTIPFVQLDPLKTILVFSHEHNTFDKRKLLEGSPHPDFIKESPKTVDMFIRRPNEKPIRDFFMNDIKALLVKYDAGSPKMKPDVLVQMKEIEELRMKMMEEERMKNASSNENPICIQQPDGTNKKLTNEEVVHILQQQQIHIGKQQEEIQQLQKRETELNELVASLQQKLIEMIVSSSSSKKEKEKPSQKQTKQTNQTKGQFTIEEIDEKEEKEEKDKKLEEILEETIKEIEIEDKRKEDDDMNIIIEKSKTEPLFTLEKEEEEEEEEQIKNRDIGRKRGEERKRKGFRCILQNRTAIYFVKWCIVCKIVYRICYYHLERRVDTTEELKRDKLRLSYFYSSVELPP